MSLLERVLPSGHRYSQALDRRLVGGREVALTQALSRDPIADATSVQRLLEADGEMVLAQTLRVEGRACDTVVDLGAGLGGGRLTLHWALMPNKQGLVAYGHGAWDDALLEEFSHQLFGDSAGSYRPADERAFGALRLDSGGFVDPPAAEPALRAALSGYAEGANAGPPPSTKSFCACLSVCADCLLAAVAAPPGANTPPLPAAVKRCTILESSALITCVARGGF